MKVDPNICVGCCCCMSVCPEQAIELKDGKAFIDPEKCKKCGACANICPMQAIKE